MAMSRLFSVTILAICVACGFASSPSHALDFPWELGTTYQYDWIEKKRKTGEIAFRFTKVSEPKGFVYRLSSHRRREDKGASQTSSGELYFKPDSVPLRYHEDCRYTASSNVSGHQEVSIKFSGEKVTSTVVHNRNEEQRSHNVTKVPTGTFLFATHALDHWTVFSPKLREKKKQTVRVFYSEFGRVLELTFAPQKKAETLVVGDQKLSVVRFRFECKDYLYNGNVWIDKRGRLIQYESGELKLVLSSPPRDA